MRPNASAQPAAASKPLSFSDVKSGDWFYPYVTELVEAGGVNGYEDGTFRPNDSITRDAVCTILPGSFLSDKIFDAAAQMMSKAQNANGDYWANRFIGQANLYGIEDFGFGRAEWGKPATREEIAYMLSCVYACAQLVRGNNEPLQICTQMPALIGDYASTVAGSRYENDILWLYSNGIVSGVNDNGDFRPKSNAPRAECYTMVVTLLHPEQWKQIDWDAVTAGTESSGSQTSSGTDFKGKTRIRYSNDVAYDFCRALEEQRSGFKSFTSPSGPKGGGRVPVRGHPAAGH